MAGGKGDASGASPRKGAAPSAAGGGKKKPAGAPEGGRGQGAAPRKQLDSLSHLQTKSSAFRGVSWSKHKQKWQSCIRIANRQFFLGRYADECEAARAYDRAAICYYSPEAARTNFPMGQYEAELGTLQRMDIQLYAATSQQHSRALTSHLRRAAQMAGKAAHAAGGGGSPGAGPSPPTARKKKLAEGGGAAGGTPPPGASAGARAHVGAGPGPPGDGGGAAAVPGVGSPSDFLAAAEERLRRQGQQGSSPGSAGAAGAGLPTGGAGAGGLPPGAAKKGAKARTPKAKVKAGGVAKGGAGPKRAPSMKKKALAAAQKRAEAAAAAHAAAVGSFSVPRAPMAVPGGGNLGALGMGALWDPLAQGGGLVGGQTSKAVRAAPPGSGLFPHSAPPLSGLPTPPSLDDLSDDTRHLDPSEELHNLNSLFSGVMFQTGREQGDLREKQFDVLAGQDAVLGLQGGARTELESVLRAEADALALRDQLELQYRHNMQLWESSLLEFAAEVSPSGAAPGQLPPMPM